MLNEKQKRFCEEYLVDLNATQAYIRAGYSEITNPSGFYVYLLIDPTNDEIFYIGKGTGKRALAHMREKGKTGQNLLKIARINRIKREGLSVKVLYFQDNLSEIDAFRLEKALIESFCDTPITNIMLGVNKQTPKYWAALWYPKIKKLSKFIKTATPQTVEIYFMMIQAMNQMLTDPRFDRQGRTTLVKNSLCQQVRK